MSKTFAGICVALLSLILIVQIVTLFVSVRPRVAVNSLSARANMAGPNAYYDPCYLGTCPTPHNFSGSSVSSSWCNTDPNGDNYGDGC
jgi:hypothetical protein